MRHCLISSLLTLSLLGTCCGQTTFVNNVSGSVTIGGAGPLLGPPGYLGSALSQANPYITSNLTNIVFSGSSATATCATTCAAPIATGSWVTFNGNSITAVNETLGLPGFTVTSVTGSPITSFSFATTIAAGAGTGGTVTYLPINAPNMGGSTGVNSTGYAYSSPGNFYYPAGGTGTCYTRVSDANTDSNQSFGTTLSGGANDNMWSLNRDYMGITINNVTSVHFLSLSYLANGCAQVNNLANPTAKIAGAGSAGFSRVTDNKFYYTHAVGGQLQLNSVLLSGTSTVAVSAPTTIFDFATCPGPPGTTVSGILGPANSDSGFVAFGTFTNGAYSGLYLAWLYQPGIGCSTWYTGDVTQTAFTGNVWAPCLSSCGAVPPLGLNTVCAQPGFTIHDGQVYLDGLAIVISGMCNGVTNSTTTFIPAATFGSVGMFWCGPGALPGNGCEGTGHGSAGLLKQLGLNNPNALNTRPRSTPLISTDLATYPLSENMEDHGAPLRGRSDVDAGPVLHSSSACKPNAFCGELFAVKQDGSFARFGPNFNTGSSINFRTQQAIPSVSNDGVCMAVASDWNKTLGLDNGTQPRGDVFAVCNLQ